MENFYIYIYLDPRKNGDFSYDDLKFDYEPFYVGKGKGNRIEKSLFDYRFNEYKKNKIDKIKKEGLNPISIKLFENLTEVESFEKEIQTILKIGRSYENGPLTNIQKGGNGGDNYTNHINPRKRIEKRLDTIRRNKENGIKYSWKLSDESKMKISQNNKGLKRSDEVKENLRIKNLGKKRSEESKLKQSLSCKKTLSERKNKHDQSGTSNSNSKKYIIKINETNEIKEFEGYKSILDFYNNLSKSEYKDHYFLISKLKNNSIKEISLINIIKNKGFIK
jgi:hypothetical protein